MGRLEDIIDRNKHPRKHRQTKLPTGMIVAGFVLLVLVLMIFTDAGLSPMPAPPPPAAQQGPATDPSERRVDGVLLYRAPAPGDAAADSK